MKKLIFILTIILANINVSGINPIDSIPLPKPNQLKWQEAEIGAVFHYDLHVFDSTKYSQNHNRITPIADHNILNPKHLDTDQWVKAAKEAGCKFAILTATHETGFGLWQSDVNPYCLKAVRWRDGKGDIVRDFVNSCRKYGLSPGIYIGIRWNSLLGIHNFKADGADEFAKKRQTWYKSFCEKMVEEICTRYGNLFLIWFDGGADDPRSLGPDVEPIVNKYQPDCLFYHNVDRADIRWGGSESGTVAYPCWSTFPTPFSHSNKTDTIPDYNERLRHGDKNGKYWMPAMADVPLRGANGRHEWFWEPGDDDNVLSVSSLMEIYENSVGRNATLVLGLTPNADGLIPAKDLSVLRAFGNEIKRRFSAPIAVTGGKSKNLHLKLNNKFPINYFIIKENIKNGEKIRRYRIEAKTDSGWLTVCSGESIGHKRIQKITPVRADQFRFIVEDAIGQPEIESFSIYACD